MTGRSWPGRHQREKRQDEEQARTVVQLLRGHVLLNYMGLRDFEDPLPRHRHLKSRPN